MNRRRALLAGGAIGASIAARAFAQRSSSAPRVEGRDVVLDVVDAKADIKLIEETARRFEREKVRLIYCTPTTTTLAVKRATSQVPIFFCVGTDPIASGFVASFAKPGGRRTGVHYLTTDLTAKRLELAKDLLPKLRRVLTLYNPGHLPARESARLARDAGRRLGIEIVERHAASREDIRAAIAALNAGDADAYLQLSDAAVSAQYESANPPSSCSASSPALRQESCRSRT